MRVSVRIRRFSPYTPPMNSIPPRLVLDNGCEFEGFLFGSREAVSNEVVFNEFHSR